MKPLSSSSSAAWDPQQEIVEILSDDDDDGQEAHSTPARQVTTATASTLSVPTSNSSNNTLKLSPATALAPVFAQARSSSYLKPATKRKVEEGLTGFRRRDPGEGIVKDEGDVTESSSVLVSKSRLGLTLEEERWIQSSNEQKGEDGGLIPQPAKKRKMDALKDAQPLAERLRPSSLDTYVGQSDIIGPGSLLRSMLDASAQSQSAPTLDGENRASGGLAIGSCIFWGPPGSGKTTLARLIATTCDADFREMSATSAGSADVRKVFEEAKNKLKLIGRRTILFLDEIHRFTRPQQDLFLPFVESGAVILIGATTENPSFKVNGALLSRCRVFTLNKLSPEELEQILKNAVASFSPPPPRLPAKLLPFLADVADGDARQALNCLELAMNVCRNRETTRTNDQPTDTRGLHKEVIGDENVATDVKTAEEEDDNDLFEAVKKGLRKGYDRTGEERYDMISALHKSIRGSDGSAALYWLARMLTGGEDPIYIARRLVVVASEDVGLADPHGLPLATATYQACQVIGMPECRINLAHCVAYLSEAKKSTRSYEAYNRAEALAKETTLPGVPLQIRNAPTRLMKDLGYGKGYAYDPGYKHPVHNEFLPVELKGRSTHGNDSLLHTAEQWNRREDKEWSEGRLRSWEWKRQGGKDWEGRKSVSKDGGVGGNKEGSA